MGCMPDEKKLNTSQQEAIHHTTGPLLVIAGAGTGKTTVVTERVKFLITEGLAKPEELLCLTFTEKAAREMEVRIDQALPLGYSQLWITTFHSFCDRILRDEAINIGLDPSYRLMTETDAVSLVQRSLFTLPLQYYRPLGNPQKFIAGLLQHISRLQDEDITPEEYAHWVSQLPETDEKKQYQELSACYTAYEELKIKESVLDFSNLIGNTLKLFRQRPNILKRYQKNFKFILVDEFQDTNYAQNQLVNLLVNEPQNITVVADDDQAIYRWRGAAVSNVMQFRDIYPDAKLVVLTQNYRSTQEILDRAHDLIQFNNPDRLEVKEHIDKKLKSNKTKKGEPIEFLHFPRVDFEAEGVAKKIVELIENSKTSERALTPKDFAILVRANAHAEPFMRALDRLGVHQQFLGPTKLFQQAEIKDLIAYLQVLDDISNESAFYRVISMEYFDIPGRDIATLTSFTKRSNLTLFEVCEVVSGFVPPPQNIVPPTLDQDSVEKLNGLLSIIRRQLGQLNQETAGQLLYDFLQDTGLFKAILEFRHPIDETRAGNISRFFDKVKSYELIHPQATVRDIVNWLDIASQLGESPIVGDGDWLEQDAVNIMTIHSSKGLEFPVVFLVNLVSQRFPTIARKEQIPIPEELIKETLPTGDYHIQEERRLFYVGLTRACEKLYLTASDYYGDAKRQKKLSPFIAETIGEAKLSTHQPIVTQMSLFEFPNRPSVVSIKKDTPPYKVEYLSYSQIQTFLDCPLHYKARYILKLPSPPSAPATFGSCIHITLKDFYNQLIEDKSVDKSQYVEKVLEIYNKNWNPIGYEHKVQAQEYKDRGIRYLANYVQNHIDPNNMPIKLEEPFTVPLKSSDGKYLKIGGKIDRVDQKADGSIEIIDYKTSEHPWDQKEADSSLQLSFYALAASLLPNQPFAKSPEKVFLTLHFFETDTRVTTSRTVADLQAAKEKIFEYASSISTSDFKCSGSMLCRDCDFKLLCSYGESF